MTRKHTFTVRGIRLRATIYERAPGEWKVLSIGSVDIPTPLLPFDLSAEAQDAVRMPPQPSLERAKAALTLAFEP